MSGKPLIAIELHNDGILPWRGVVVPTHTAFDESQAPIQLTRGRVGGPHLEPHAAGRDTAKCLDQRNSDALAAGRRIDRERQDFCFAERLTLGEQNGQHSSVLLRDPATARRGLEARAQVRFRPAPCLGRFSQDFNQPRHISGNGFPNGRHLTL
jgi:hypothetical protein